MYYSNDPSINFEEKLYSITLDPTTQKVKPKKDRFTIGKISNNVKEVTEVSIKDFQRLSSRPLSFTWFGGLLNGNICNENWIQQSVFAIDFDKGNITIDEVLKRLHEIRVYPQLWYTSLNSSNELIKFRVVLFVDIPIRDIHHRDNIVLGLLKLFPEADQRCKNASRFYFGGIESHILHFEPIPTQILLDNMCVQLITIDGGRTRLLKDTSCKLGEKRTLLYNIYRNDQISPTGNNIPTLIPTYLVGGCKIDFNKARSCVRILDEFLKGTWLFHDQIFGLATHLVYIRGGLKLMKDTMNRYNQLGITQYTLNNFNILKYIKNVEYSPVPIYKFSKYKEDSEIHDFLTATKNIRGLIEVIRPKVKIPLMDAEKLFKDALDEALQEDSNDIYLFALPTAIGKTNALTTINATIAAPTNDLKVEISARMKVDHRMTPNPIRFDNQSINNKIDYYYRIGKPKNVIAILNELAISNDEMVSDMDKELARNYIRENKASSDFNGTILTTHARVMNTKYNNDVIVFDEDPLSTLLEIKQMDITDLMKIKLGMNKNNDLNNVISFLESTTIGLIYETPTYIINLEEMIEDISLSTIESNIFDFFDSCFFIRDNKSPHIIHYIRKKELPENKKIIIMSATIPVFIYKKLYSDRVKVIDVSDVQQVGKVIQYTSRSCSRNSLNRYVSDISKEVGDKPVLTFKSFGAHFNNPIKDMYFGNCSGYNSMAGKNMVVVGTPHRNNIEPMLIAKAIGIDVKTIDNAVTYQKIEFNGFRFMFNCFENEELREIQLGLIQSDLNQAVGRARTLRTKAKVEVYSNFPLSITDEFLTKY